MNNIASKHILLLDKTIIVIFALAPAVAVAQTANPYAPPNVAASVGPSSLTSPITSDSGVQLSGTQDSSSVTLKAGRTGTVRDGENLSESISANIPVVKSTNPSALSGLSTLPNAYTITGKVGWARVFGMKNFALAQLEHYCDLAHDKYKNNLLKIGHTDQEADQMAKKEFPEGECKGSQIAKFAPDLYPEAISVGWDPKNSYQILAGGVGSFGYNEHDYYLATSTNKQITDKYPWSLGGYFSWEPAGQTSLVTLTYKYQYSFKDRKTKIVCPGTSGAPNNDCVSGFIGAPIRQIGDIFGLELRHYFGKLPVLGAVAASPTFNYDARHGIYGVDLPIYLFQFGGKNGFAGGPQISWSSDTHVVLAGLFISKSFSLIQTP